MTRHPLTLAPLLALLAALACDRDKAPTPTSPAAREHISSRAPYRLALPAGWSPEDATPINSYADLAASHQGTLLLVVIPQQLPDDDASLTSQDLMQSSLDLLSSQTPELRVLTQGPISLDGTSGHAVRATGLSQGSPVHYILHYVVHDRWGLQIVAVSAPEHEPLLAQQLDNILSSWRWTSP